MILAETKLMLLIAVEVKLTWLYRGSSHPVIWWWRRQSCNVSCH